MSDLVRTRGRERCPTCSAPRHGDALCHRCKSDLVPLLRLEHRVDHLAAEARRCYARGWYRRAAAVAAEAVSLEASPDHLSLLACANLMAGDFRSAADAWRRSRL